MHLFWKALFFFAVTLSLHSLQQSVSAEQARLPYPRALFHKVEFWKSVYTKYSTKEGILHDADDLSIVYEKVVLPPNGSQQVVGERRASIRQAIFSILRKRGQNLSATERKVLARFPKYASRSRLLQATENIRFQLGQSDRFRAGIIKSGRYLPHIEKMAEEVGAPDFLKYLPHVESSFQRTAMSKYGAAGLWQIMPKTGRGLNLRIDYLIDERLDPWKASKAGLTYLKRNYKSLGEWPLAITAYNHGAGGVRRAVRTLGSTDIAEIAFQYSTRSFGFASRNFYAQFLAAVQVAQDYKKFFGPLELDRPLSFETVKIPKATYFRSFAKKYRFTDAEFKQLNPALRKPIYDNKRPIPKSYVVRVPRGSSRPKVMVASLDDKIPTEALKPPVDENTLPEKEIQKIATPSRTLLKGPPAQTPAAKESLPEDTKVSSASPSLPQLDEFASDSRYAVKDLVDRKAWVRVEINETISQVAEWLNVNTAELREWNGIEKRGQVRLGQRLIVKFGAVSPTQFQSAREDYHRKIKEDFFSQFEVDKLLDYEVKVGENLWSICFQKFEIPPWLLEQFNPQVIAWDLKPGQKLKIPVVVESIAGVGSDTEAAALGDAN